MTIGYKGTYDFKCQEQFYEIGSEHKINEIKICESGFHFCEKIGDVNNYYSFKKPNFIMLEVEALGKVLTDRGKSVTDHIKILRVIPKEEYLGKQECYNGYKTFDSNGRVIREETSDGSWTTWEYDSNGRVIREETSDGSWTTWEYDSNGNKVREENSNGYWVTWEYDSNGNLIRTEYSTDYWVTYEYDSNGRVIRFETSNGYWKTNEYDSNGNIIREESYTGYWRTWEYDSNGKLIREENSNGLKRDFS